MMWIVLAGVAPVWAATKNDLPDREMLRMMEFLREMELIKQMEMLRELEVLSESDGPGRSAVKRSATEKKREIVK